MQTSPGTSAREEATADLRLSLIAGFGLRHAAQPIPLPTSAQRVIAYLAIHERPSLRTHVAASLWLDTPEERALANLRSALWRLRRPGLTIVEVAGDQMWLAESVRVDLRELSLLARHLLDDGWAVEPAAAERLMGAGELLPGWYDDWVFVERERFRHLRLHALERACAGLATAGDFGRAIEACLAAVIEEPLRESAHRGLIAAHLAEGNRVEALRQFETYRRLMDEELGLAPSAAMLALVDQVAPGRWAPTGDGAAGGNGAASGDGGAHANRAAERSGDGWTGMRVGHRAGTIGRGDPGPIPDARTAAAATGRPIAG